MAMGVSTVDEKEVESKQTELLQETAKEMNKQSRKCFICGKLKKSLYLCKHDGCAQAYRLICKKCGVITHNIQHAYDSDDDDDEDEEEQEEGKNNNHIFDTKKPYIEKVNLEQLDLVLSNVDKLQIKKSSSDTHWLLKTIEESNSKDARVNFELGASGFFNSVLLYDNVRNYIPNVNYWKPWGETLIKSMKNGEIKTSVTKISQAVFGIGDRAFEYTQISKEGSFLAGAIVFACETSYHTYRYYRGYTNREQYLSKVATAAAVTAGSMVGNIGGATVGAIIGTYMLPFIGTAACSAIGGLLGGIYVGIQAKNTMENDFGFITNEEKEKNEKLQLLKESLIAFGFDENDISNNEIFNIEAIGKEYRRLAKKFHPDVKGGSQEKFLLLTSRMTILLAIVDQNNNVKKETIKQLQKAIELKYKMNNDENDKDKKSQ